MSPLRPPWPARVPKDVLVADAAPSLNQPSVKASWTGAATVFEGAVVGADRRLVAVGCCRADNRGRGGACGVAVFLRRGGRAASPVATSSSFALMTMRSLAEKRGRHDVSVSSASVVFAITLTSVGETTRCSVTR